MDFQAIVLGLQHAAEGAAHAAAPSINPWVVWLIPLLPVAGFLFQVFIGHRAPKPVVGLVSCGVIAAAAAIAWTLFAMLMGMDEHHRRIEADLGAWIQVPGMNGPGTWLHILVNHKLVVDPLTSVMILVVTNIAFFIHLYSTGYMAEEKRFARYFAYLNLFTGFMLILVMGSNLLLMFVGWEGVGLCSYLLIGFWFEKKENAAAGMKAFIVNRVGDFAFTIGVLTLFVWLGRNFDVWTLDFEGLRKIIVEKQDEIPTALATFVGIMLFIGATGKSAQIPLFVWLPDAMAGPTPVSALIHAATMVTAGVYMIARMNFLYALAPGALAVVATVGALTALFAGTIGITQNDIKKVLAYSTVSQLGFMFLAVGVGAFAAGVFHLFTHAFFKACLFLGSGSVIHGMGGEQDIRKMGGLKSKMPWTWATFGISTLAIAGIFPFAGFFSKDEILWKTFNTSAFPHGWEWLRFVLYAIGVISALCTAFYMTRLVIKTFHGDPKWATAGAHAGGGKDEDDEEPMPLPDDASLLDLGAIGKKKNPPPPPPKPDDESITALPDDASLLDLGAVGKKRHAPPPRPDDESITALPDDASLLDLGAVGHKKKHPAPEPVPHSLEDESINVAPLPDDASLLDLGGKSHAAAAAHGAHDAHDAHAGGGHGHDDDAGHGHGGGHGHGEPHECPWSMRSALVVLAVCATFVGFLGLPHVMGPNLFEHWLHPVFKDGEAILAKHAAHAVAPEAKHGEAAHHGSAALEWALMGFSLAVAILGIMVAVKIYLKGKGAAAEKFAAEHPELYKLVLDKYRVDELYEASVIQPTLSLNETAAVFDAKIIDGAVNGAAAVGRSTSGGIGVFDNEIVDGGVNFAATATQEVGRRVRRMQTGNIRDYLTIALVGALFVIAVFCLWLRLRP